MNVSRRTAVALLSVTALAGSAATAVTAAGHDGGGGSSPGRSQEGKALLETTLAPSVPSDPQLDRAAAGNVPWVLRRGEARLRRDGELRVRLRGLVIPTGPDAGTTGPVASVSASLYCGQSSTAQGTTPTVPISTDGNAELSGMVTVPAKCLAPTVLVHPNGKAGAYISASGFGG